MNRKRGFSFSPQAMRSCQHSSWTSGSSSLLLTTSLVPELSQDYPESYCGAKRVNKYINQVQFRKEYGFFRKITLRYRFKAVYWSFYKKTNTIQQKNNHQPLLFSIGNVVILDQISQPYNCYRSHLVQS